MKIILYPFLLILLVAAVAVGHGQQQHTRVSRQTRVMSVRQGKLESNEDLIARLKQTIPQAMVKGGVTGLSIALIRNGKMVWSHGFGLKNAETREPVDQRTVFEAASLGKPVFAYAVMKLVEQGRLDLDTPLNNYLPHPDLENDERLKLITARRVLTHTAGLPNWRPRGKALQIYFMPGERFSYSGEGYVYLQRVVEKITGHPLDQFMKQNVFEPLGMTSSSYLWRKDYESQKAYAHDAQGQVSGRDEPEVANAAASLHTTAIDYAKFVAALMNRKGLKAQTLQEMFRPQVKVDADCSNCIGQKPGKHSEDISWGLGWGLEHTTGGDLFWHWGDNGDFKAYVAASDRTRTGFVFFTNSANGLSMVNEVMNQVFGIKQSSALKWLKYKELKYQEIKTES